MDLGRYDDGSIDPRGGAGRSFTVNAASVNTIIELRPSAVVLVLVCLQRFKGARFQGGGEFGLLRRSS